MASSTLNVYEGAMLRLRPVNSVVMLRGTIPALNSVPCIVNVLPEFVTPSVKTSALFFICSTSLTPRSAVVANTPSCVACSSRTSVNEY